jgi:hypothetical protein
VGEEENFISNKNRKGINASDMLRAAYVR